MASLDIWGEEATPWEARGQALWKSSDDEATSDWNSYDEYDYALENDDEGVAVKQEIQRKKEKERE